MFAVSLLGLKTISENLGSVKGFNTMPTVRANLTSRAPAPLALSLLSLGLAACQFKEAQKAIVNQKENAPAPAPVSGIVDDSHMGEAKGLRDRFFAAVLSVDSKNIPQAKMALDAFITKELADGANSQDPNLRFYLAQLNLLQKTKSIIWRATNTVKNKNDSLHSGIVTQLMLAATGLDIYLPTAQWKAGFAYITEPFENNLPAYNGQNDAQAVAWIRQVANTELKPALEAMAATFEQLANTPNVKIVVDNQMLAAPGTFAVSGRDDIRRYFAVDASGLRAAAASIHAGLHAMYLSGAYNMDGLPAYITEISRIMMLDGMGPLNVRGLSSLRRTEVIRKIAESHPKFLTLNSGATQAHLMPALEELKKSLALVNQIWIDNRGKPASEYLSMGWVSNLPVQPSNVVVAAVAAMMRTPAEFVALTSHVTGQQVMVNFQALYTDPIPDLKALLPNSFVTDPALKTVTVGNTQIRNYRYEGAAQGAWNAAAYAKYVYLPDATDPSKPAAAQDMPTAMRILSQSSGGVFLHSPFALFIN